MFDVHAWPLLALQALVTGIVIWLLVALLDRGNKANHFALAVAIGLGMVLVQSTGLAAVGGYVGLATILVKYYDLSLSRTFVFMVLMLAVMLGLGAGKSALLQRQRDERSARALTAD